MAKAPVKRSTASSAPQSMILQLKEAFDTGTDEEKQAMREMFPGMQTADQKVVVDRTNLSLDEQLHIARSQPHKQQGTTSAQMIVMTQGSVTHPDGWEPRPPEHVTEIGEEAEKLWLLRWHQGKAGGSMEMFRRELGSGNADIGESVIENLEANADAIPVGGDGAPVLQEAGSYLSMENESGPSE